MRKKNRIYIVGECIKYASFGIDTPLYCSSHKSDGMEDIVNVRCGVNECKKGRGEKIGVVVKLSLKGGVMTLWDGEKNYGESICFFTKLIF